MEEKINTDKTYIIFVAGFDPNPHNISLLENALLVQNISLKIYDIPKQNILIFMKGDNANYSAITNITENQALYQHDSGRVFSRFKTNVIYYRTSKSFFTSLGLKVIQPNSTIFIFLDYNANFSKTFYLHLYQSIRNFEPNLIRIFVDAGNSLDLIGIIKEYNSQFLKLIQYTKNNDRKPVNLCKLAPIFNLLKKYSNEQINFFFNFLNCVPPNVVRWLVTNSQIVSLRKVLGMGDEISFDQLGTLFPESGEMALSLKSLGVSTFADLRVITDAFSYREISNDFSINKLRYYFNPENLKMLNIIEKNKCNIVGNDVGTAIDNFWKIYPPHEDMKIVTSSAQKSSLFSLADTKLKVGTTFMPAAINEVFLNFTSEPISLNRIYRNYAESEKDEKSSEYPGENFLDCSKNIFTTKCTGYDRLYPSIQESLKLKIAIIREAASSIRKVLIMALEECIEEEAKVVICPENMKYTSGKKMGLIRVDYNNESNDKKSVDLTCQEKAKKTDNMKVLESPIKVAIMERNFQDSIAIASLAFLSYKLNQPLPSEDNYYGVSLCVKTIVETSIMLFQSGKEAAIVAKKAHDILLDIIMRSIERFPIKEEVKDETVVQKMISEMVSKNTMILSVIGSLIKQCDLANILTNLQKIKEKFLYNKQIAEALEKLSSIKVESEVISILVECSCNEIYQIIQEIIKIKKNEFEEIVQASFSNSDSMNLSNLGIPKDILEKTRNFIRNTSDRALSITLINSVRTEKLTELVMSADDIAPASPELVDVLLDMASIDLYCYSAIYVIELEKLKEGDVKMDGLFYDTISAYVDEPFVDIIRYPFKTRVGEAMDKLKDPIIKEITENIQSLITFRSKRFIEAMDRINQRNMKFNIKSTFCELISKDLLDKEKVFTFLRGFQEDISQILLEKTYHKCVIIGKRFWKESVSMIMTAQIPREPENIIRLMPMTNNEIFANVRAMLDDTVKEIHCESSEAEIESLFKEVGIFNPDSDIVRKCAIDLFMSLHLSASPSTLALRELFMTSYDNLINQTLSEKCNEINKIKELCRSKDITPQRNDIMLILGYVQFRLCGKDKFRVRMKTVDRRKKLKESYCGRDVIVSYLEDEYYSDDSGTGIRGSGQFLDLNDYVYEDSDENKEIEEKEHIWTREEVREISSDYSIPKEGWGNDVFTVFTGQFAKKVKKLGLSFTPVINCKNYGYSRQYEKAYQEVLDMLPLCFVKKFQDVMHSYQYFFSQHLDMEKELRKAFVRSFDEADRVVTPIYHPAETIWRSGASYQ